MKTFAPIFALICSTLASPIAELDSRSIEKRAYGGPPSTGEVCPEAQGFFYRGNSGGDLQIACNVDIYGGYLLAVYPNIPGVVGCAAQCDLWSVQVPGNKCTGSTWYRVSPDGVNNCLIRNGAWTAYTGNSTAANAVSAIPS